MSLAVSQLGQRNPDKANELPSHCAVPLPWESQAPAQKWVGWAVPRGGRAIPPATRRPLACCRAGQRCHFTGSTASWRHPLQRLGSHQLIASPWALAPSQGELHRAQQGCLGAG